GLIDEACPHRTASMFFGRNEDCGLRCVYHGIKFDVDGNCVDVPCLPPGTPENQIAAIKKNMAIKAYPCVEHGGMIWTYMGPAGEEPELPLLEWTEVPDAHRFATRRIQECNWLQGVDGGFDQTHLPFLHSGDVDKRRGDTDRHRRIIPSEYESVPLPAGFAFGARKEIGDGMGSWHVELMLMPFHKVIPSVPRAAHVWVPIDDETTMLYSINFNTERPLTDGDLERELAWRGIHSEPEPGSDRAKQTKSNDYLIDRDLQASGKSFSGIKSLGAQDSGIQESMGPIADRGKEHLLICDSSLMRVRRLYLDTLDAMAAGKPPPGREGASYRVRALRLEAPADSSFSELVESQIWGNRPAAAE
ncbi:MAG: Rieske 2Fe-2S domain-containing protein, partial [Alphaproteobacteria bacterium]|nr:Rieske 2Fe-2S domain-containing protein [Alphaproteobacteria bacterium]